VYSSRLGFKDNGTDYQPAGQMYVFIYDPPHITVNEGYQPVTRRSRSMSIYSLSQALTVITATMLTMHGALKTPPI
jgi:hypothetical protein